MVLLRKHLHDDSSLGVDELAPQRGGALPEAAQDPRSLLLVVVGGRALPVGRRSRSMRYTRMASLRAVAVIALALPARAASRR